MGTPKCIVKRITAGKFKNQYRFRLNGTNGKCIATSGSETYHNKADLLTTVEKYFPNFEIIKPSEDVRQRDHKPLVKAPDKATTQKAKHFANKVIEEALKKQETELEEQIIEGLKGLQIN